MIASAAAALRSTAIPLSLNSSNNLPTTKWTREQSPQQHLIHIIHRSLSFTSFLSRCYPERELSSQSFFSEQISDHSSDPYFSHPEINHLNARNVPSASGQAPPLSPSSSSRGLVFDLGLNGSWDSGDVGSPVVKRYVSDDRERWFMWYHGVTAATSDRGDAVGVAFSNNGIQWERGTGAIEFPNEAGQVMRRSADWWAFDKHGVRPSDVLIMSSAKIRDSKAVYWLFYTGFGPDKPLPGLAMSQDGSHWARIEGEHHSGALLDAGAAGQWDSTLIASPKVVYHARGDLRMYYHSLEEETGQHVIGIARSRDGIRWVKLGKVLGGSGVAASFDEAGVRHGHVVRSGVDGGGYLMIYEGVAVDGRTSVGMAASTDGLKGWRRCRSEAVLMVEEDGWDCGGVGEPCLVPMDGGDSGDWWRLYYRGIGRDGRAGIGLAVCQGKEISGFERWSGFQV